MAWRKRNERGAYGREGKVKGDKKTTEFINLVEEIGSTSDLYSIWDTVTCPQPFSQSINEAWPILIWWMEDKQLGKMVLSPITYHFLPPLVSVPLLISHRFLTCPLMNMSLLCKAPWISLYDVFCLCKVYEYFTLPLKK